MAQPPRASHWQGRCLHATCCSSTPPPVAHLSLGHPSSPESTCPARNICHSCTNICLSRPAYLFPHIFVFLIYLSRPNICLGRMFLSHICFSESVSFPCFISRSAAAKYILSKSISVKSFTSHLHLQDDEEKGSKIAKLNNGILSIHYLFMLCSGLVGCLLKSYLVRNQLVG